MSTTQPAARLNDSHACPQSGHEIGQIISSNAKTLINGQPAARVGDQVYCNDGSVHTITQGSSCVFIDGQPAARLNDASEHGGVLSSGSSNVFIGTGGNTRVHISGSVKIGGNPAKRVSIGGKTISPDTAHVLPPEPLTPEEHTGNLQLIYHYYNGKDAHTPVAQLAPKIPNDTPTWQSYQAALVAYPQLPKPNYHVKVAGKTDTHWYAQTLNQQGHAVIQSVPCGEVTPIDTGGLTIIQVNGKTQSPWQPLQLQNSSPPCHTLPPDKAHTYELTAVWPIIMQNYHDYIRDCIQVVGNHPCQTPHHLPELASKPRLRPEDLAYFKANGDNVTLFIHGFNVEVGRFSPQAYHATVNTITNPFEQVEALAPLPGLKAVQLATNTYACTVLRTPADLHTAFPAIPANPLAINTINGVMLDPDTHDFDQAVNGQGACNWALHMEYNINCAATGQYPFDWSAHALQYTRLLHVLWPGMWRPWITWMPKRRLI